MDFGNLTFLQNNPPSLLETYTFHTVSHCGCFKCIYIPDIGRCFKRWTEGEASWVYGRKREKKKHLLVKYQLGIGTKIHNNQFWANIIKTGETKQLKKRNAQFTPHNNHICQANSTTFHRGLFVWSEKKTPTGWNDQICQAVSTHTRNLIFLSSH